MLLIKLSLSVISCEGTSHSGKVNALLPSFDISNNNLVLLL